MNLKRAKRLRKILRTMDVDPSNTEYTLGSYSQYLADNGVLTPDKVTIVLAEGCGRQMYKQLKRAHRG